MQLRRSRRCPVSHPKLGMLICVPALEEHLVAECREGWDVGCKKAKQACRIGAGDLKFRGSSGCAVRDPQSVNRVGVRANEHGLVAKRRDVGWAKTEWAGICNGNFRRARCRAVRHPKT